MRWMGTSLLGGVSWAGIDVRSCPHSFFALRGVCRYNTQIARAMTEASSLNRFRDSGLASFSGLFPAQITSSYSFGKPGFQAR